MKNEASQHRAERADATRDSLVAAARRLFGAKGYAETSLREIVGAANVTKGAFYHHFMGKEDIFGRVFEEVHREIGRRAFVVHLDHERSVGGQPGIRDLHAETNETVWRHLLRGCRTYLELHTDPEVQRIALIDGRSVLGWDRWHQVHSEHSVVLLRADLRRAMRRQIIRALPLQTLATLLAGALDEGCIAIANSEDPHAAVEDALSVIDRFLAGLRVPSDGRSE